MGKPTGQRFKSVWDALPVDLLGDTISTPKRTNDRPETAAGGLGFMARNRRVMHREQNQLKGQ
jgi:hypothetical protein